MVSDLFPPPASEASVGGGVAAGDGGGRGKWQVPPSRPAAVLSPSGGETRAIELAPGKIVGLEGPAGLGLTRVGLSLLIAPSQVGTVVVIDARGGWFSPLAAWEVGVKPSRLVVVRCSNPRLWAKVCAAVLEGVAAVYAEVPTGVGENELRRLAALTRARKAGLALRPIRGQLPAGITHLRLKGSAVSWEGPERGHGALRERRLSLEVSGKSLPWQELQATA